MEGRGPGGESRWMAGGAVEAPAEGARSSQLTRTRVPAAAAVLLPRGTRGHHGAPGGTRTGCDLSMVHRVTLVVGAPWFNGPFW